MSLTRGNLAQMTDRYNFLIETGDYDNAYGLFREYLDIPTLQGIGEICQQRVPLLEALFPQWIEQKPALTDPQNQLKVLHDLGLAYISGSGLPGRARKMYPQLIALAEQLGDEGMLGVSLGNFAKALRQTGHIRQADAVARRGLVIQNQSGSNLHKATNFYRYGMGLAQRGVKEDSERILTQALTLFQTLLAEQEHAMVTDYLGQRALWMGDAEGALTHARRTWEIADALASNSTQMDLNGIFKVRTSAARMIGEALLMLGDLDEAELWVSTGLSTANLVNMVEEMLPISHIQAEIARQRGQIELAQHTLQATWELAKTGEYMVYHADSCVLLARLHEDKHENDAAIAAAQNAYRISWCDGPPFAYQRGLEKSRAILERLDSALPEMPVYDDTHWPALPEISF